jgi:glycosyltransferase involved in cell wall biosynthesis
MKKVMLICAPVSSRSGYGDHARDIVSSFIEHDKYDIKILDVRWGHCPRTALNDNNKPNRQILDRILAHPTLDSQPDVYVDIRIPNEFETYGKFNIGITAGIETDIISPKWIDGCNKMDLVIVPSEHSKNGIVKTVYDKLQNLPDGKQQKAGVHTVNKPVEVLFEGVDTSIYKPIKNDEIDSEFFDNINNIIPEDFAFLFVGLWGTGGYGEDRKDIGTLIKVFIEAFSNKKKKPVLILKTNGSSFSTLDKEECLVKIDEIKSKFPSNFEIPNIYLLHGDLKPNEMNYLYNHPKIKAMVSFTHGEGFGRPLLEASMVGLPVIASGWSGQLDFLGDDSVLLQGTLIDVPSSVLWQDIIVENSKWFKINEDAAYNTLNFVFDNYFEIKRKAEVQLRKNINKFTLENMSKKLDEIVSPNIEKIPTITTLKLPKLKRVDSKLDLPKIKLPTLKKV